MSKETRQKNRDFVFKNEIPIFEKSRRPLWDSKTIKGCLMDWGGKERKFKMLFGYFLIDAGYLTFFDEDINFNILFVTPAALNNVATRRQAYKLRSKRSRNCFYLFTVFGVNVIALVDKNRDRKSTRLNSSHTDISRMPSSA